MSRVLTFRRAVVLLLAACLLGSATALARVPVRTIKLTFVPSDPEDVLEKRAVVPASGPPFEILPAIDARQEPLDLIGKSLERWVPDPDFPRSRPQEFDVEIRTRPSSEPRWNDTFDWRDARLYERQAARVLFVCSSSDVPQRSSGASFHPQAATVKSRPEAGRVRKA